MKGPTPSPPTRLSRAALAFRTAHATIAFEQLLAIAYVWWCALSGRRGRLLRIAAASLIGEGVLVAANHGDCPLGGMKSASATPFPCLSWCSHRAPRSGRYRRLALSQRAGSYS